MRPGTQDDVSFEQHWSVSVWRNWAWPPPDADLKTGKGLRVFAAALAKNASQASTDPTSAAYWAYHTARFAFFCAQVGVGAVMQGLLTGKLQPGQKTEMLSHLDAYVVRVVCAPGPVAVSAMQCFAALHL
jgi:hypothetical protein